MGKVVHGCLPRKKKGGTSGMGAGKGKKNAGVGVDFKRVKHKVGKKLPKAQNETDASFKSHTINLPSQSVQQDKDGIAVNFQNLSLQAGWGWDLCWDLASHLDAHALCRLPS